MKSKATKRKRITLDEQVAYHEAGHVVAHHALGHGVGWVSIPLAALNDPLTWKRGKYGVRVLHGTRLNDRTPRGQRLKLQGVMGLMAGHMAQRLHHGRRRRLRGSDYETCAHFLESFIKARHRWNSVPFVGNQRWVLRGLSAISQRAQAVVAATGKAHGAPAQAMLADGGGGRACVAEGAHAVRRSRAADHARGDTEGTGRAGTPRRGDGADDAGRIAWGSAF